MEQGTDNNKGLNVCLNCSNHFVEWNRETECECDEGTIEVPQDFGDSYTWEICNVCNGKGVINWNEKSLCSENCLEEYMERQLN